MSYQVLARKWRPASFEELVGQQQTAQALINSLDSQRLHHAYLFTGTRGVGKTTIARILSKSLNCESGITSKPCGNCSSCQEISKGGFVDLLEIDAASKTKVEDTRELLDNVQYRPTRGRYKVYLIDEVHMLSGHSFNALLKTLEEPPPHVIFLLATTDPQKIPVTVLSRCLQFHLRRMEEEEIATHLAKILNAEQIDFEQQAIELISKIADGSMRDGLSLLDQAIIFSGNPIKHASVLQMIGGIEKNYSFKLLDAICAHDAQLVMQTIKQIAEYSPNYDELMADWLSLLHQVAVVQASGVSQGEKIDQLAKTISHADLQLFYQLSLNARRDLAYAPHPRQGFEMAMLRILAFKPVDPQNDAKATSKKKTLNNASEKLEQEKPLQEKTFTAEPETKKVNDNSDSKPNLYLVDNYQTKQAKNLQAKKTLPKQSLQPKIAFEQLTTANWFNLVEAIKLRGQGRQVLANALGCYQQGQLEIQYKKTHQVLLTETSQSSIKKSLTSYFKKDDLKIVYKQAESLPETPRERQIRLHNLAIEQSEVKLLEDEQIKYLMENLSASLQRESIILKPPEDADFSKARNPAI